MKKILSILGTVGMTASTSSVLVSCNNNKNKENKPAPDERKDVSTLFKTMDLEFTKDPKAEEVFNKAVEVNNIKKDQSIQLEQGEFTNSTLVIKAKEDSKDFKGQITINFKVVDGSSQKNKSESKTTNLGFDKVKKRQDWTGNNTSKLWNLNTDNTKKVRTIKFNNKEITIDIDPEIEKTLGITLDKNLVTYTTLGKDKSESCCGVNADETQFENDLIWKND